MEVRIALSEYIAYLNGNPGMWATSIILPIGRPLQTVCPEFLPIGGIFGDSFDHHSLPADVIDSLQASVASPVLGCQEIVAFRKNGGSGEILDHSLRYLGPILVAVTGGPSSSERPIVPKGDGELKAKARASKARWMAAGRSDSVNDCKVLKPGMTVLLTLSACSE